MFPPLNPAGALKDGKPPDETDSQLHQNSMLMLVSSSPHMAGLLTTILLQLQDNANYFCEYAFLYHQMDMLEAFIRGFQSVGGSVASELYGSRVELVTRAILLVSGKDATSSSWPYY